MPIEHFVGFSSIAAGIGARGQANYVAANLFLEELARCRRGLGLPALTVSWGAIGDTGVVARDDKLAALLARSGIEPLPVADALERLGFLLRRDPHVVGVARVDLGRMGAAATGLARWRRTGHLFEPRASRSGLLAVLAETAPEQRKPILMDFIAAQLGEVLRVEASKIDPALPFNDLGVDSLSSLELKTRLEASTGLALSVGKFLARPTVEGLAEAVLELLARDEDAGEDDAERPIAAE